MDTNNKKPHIIFLVLILVRLLITEIPSIKYLVPTYINMGTLFLIYLYMISKSEQFLSKSVSILPIFCVLLLEIVWSVFRGTGTFIVDSYGLIQEMMWPLAALFIMNNMNRKSTGILLLAMGVIILFLMSTTYIGCIKFPMAARYMATGMEGNQEEFSMYAALNIGDYNFLYLITYMIPLLAFLYHNFRRWRLVLLVAYIAVVIVLFTAEYTTAILVALFSGVLFLFPVSQLAQHKYVVMVSVLLVFSSLPIVASILSSFFEQSDVVSERLSDLSLFLSGDEINDPNSDIAARMEAHRESLTAFISNPLFGTGTHGGGHSYFLDTLAYLGLFGVFAIVVSYRRIFTMFFKPFRWTQMFGYISLILIFDIILCTLKGGHSLYTLFFLVPVFCTYFNEALFEEINTEEFN